jgi:hypothetical protein
MDDDDDADADAAWSGGGALKSGGSALKSLKYKSTRLLTRMF